MSAFVSATARSWSTVSSYGKLASISACQGVSAPKAWPRAAVRAAYSSRSSSARSSTARLTRCFVRSQSVPPRRLSVGSLAARVAADPLDLLDRDVDPVAAGEAQLEVVALLARCRRAGASARSGRSRGRCGRRGRPGVSRSRMSRGTTRRIAFGRRTRTVPNSSRSVTKASPSGPPMNPPFRLRSIRATAPGGGAASSRSDRADRSAGLGRAARTGARAWSEARTIRTPSSAQPSTASTSRPERRPGTLGSRQPNRSPELRPPPAIAPGRLGFPGQLERARTEQSRLPVARREVGRRPVLGQIAGRDQVGPALVGLAPQERAGLGQVAGLVEDEQRARARCGRGRSPGRRSRPRPRPRRRRRAPGWPARPSGSPRRRVAASRAVALAARTGVEVGRPSRSGQVAAGAAQPSRATRASASAARSGRGTRSPAGAWRWRPCRPSAGRSDRTGAASRSRRRRSRSGPAATRPAGTRRRSRPAGRTRPGRRPRASAGSRGRAARGGGRRARSGSPGLERSAASAGRSAGSSVRWRSAWTLATRIRADPSARRPGRRRARPSRRRRARSARRPARSAARGRRPRPGRRARRRAPRPPGRRSRRRGRSRRGARRRRPARAPPRGRTSPRAGPTSARHGGPAAESGLDGRSEPLAQRAERARRGEQRRKGRQVGQAATALRPGRRRVGRRSSGRRAVVARVGAVAGRAPRPADRSRRCLGRGGPLGASSTSRSTSATSKSTAVTRSSSDDARRSRRRRARPSRRSAPRLPRSGGVVTGRRPSPGRSRRQPVFVRRMPSGPGWAVDLAGCGASRSASAGRSWKALNRLAALFVPSRAHASTASAAASRSSSSRCLLLGRERAAGRGRDRGPSGSPIPTRSRLNFSVPSSSMIEPRPLWPPGAAALAEAQLAERQGEVVGDHEQVAERSVLAGQDLAHGEARSRS